MAEKLCQQTSYIINFIPSPSLWTDFPPVVCQFFRAEAPIFNLCLAAVVQPNETNAWLQLILNFFPLRQWWWRKKKKLRQKEWKRFDSNEKLGVMGKRKKYHKGARPRKPREKYALSVLSIDDSHQLVLQEELHLGKKVCATHLARTWWLSLYTLFFVTFRVFFMFNIKKNYTT